MDELVTALKALFEANMAAGFSFCYGENLVPERFKLPLVEVIPETTEMEIKGTGGSRIYKHTVTIQVKVDIKDFLKSNTDVSVISHMQYLVQTMEARDGSGVPLATTVLGIINNNLTASSSVQLLNLSNITYRETPYGESYIALAALSLSAVKNY